MQTRFISRLSALALSWALLSALALSGCSPKETPEVGAGVLLRAVAPDTASADRVLAFGEEAYTTRFPYLYDGELTALRDGAIAYSTSAAEEISLLRGQPETDPETLRQLLLDRVTRQISVYQSYSPEDVQLLQSAVLFTEGQWVCLIVSPRAEALRERVLSLLRDPSPLTAASEPATAPATVTEPVTEPATETLPVTEPVTETLPATEPATETLPVTEPATETLPVTEPATETPASEPDTYDYSRPVPASEPLDVSALERALFIGNSRMESLLELLPVTPAGAYAYVSYNVAQVFTMEVVKTDGGLLTVADAVRQGPAFDRCYLMFGTNELGWPNTAHFISCYEAIIALLRELNPDVQIYILTIYPVTEAYSSSHPAEGNERIDALNAQLCSMAHKQKVFFLDDRGELTDETGVLPADMSFDGVHLHTNGNRQLLAYLLSHTVPLPTPAA